MKAAWWKWNLWLPEPCRFLSSCWRCICYWGVHYSASSHVTLFALLILFERSFIPCPSFYHQDKDFYPKALCSSTTRMPMQRLVTIVTKGWHLGNWPWADVGRLERLSTATTRYPLPLFSFLTINQNTCLNVPHFIMLFNILPSATPRLCPS